MLAPSPTEGTSSRRKLMFLRGTKRNFASSTMKICIAHMECGANLCTRPVPTLIGVLSNTQTCSSRTQRRLARGTSCPRTHQSSTSAYTSRRNSPFCLIFAGDLDVSKRLRQTPSTLVRPSRTKGLGHTTCLDRERSCQGLPSQLTPLSCSDSGVALMYSLERASPRFSL